MTREVIDGVLHETVSVPLSSPTDTVVVNVVPTEEVADTPVTETPDDSPKVDGGPSVEEVVTPTE